MYQQGCAYTILAQQYEAITITEEKNVEQPLSLHCASSSYGSIIEGLSNGISC